jgi:hypothetical protein
MRSMIGLLAAGGLVLGLASAAEAQMGGFGGYPAGITTGSTSGANWSGYYGLNPGGYPLMSYNRPYSFYGSNYVLPQTGGFNTGYSTYGQPNVYYGANNYVPRTGPYAYRPTYSYRPGVTNYYSSGYSASIPGTTTSGAFVPSVTAPGTTYYMPGTTTYGTYRAPNTMTYGAPTPGGYSTYIAPSYGGYVMPQGNFVRQYVR